MYEMLSYLFFYAEKKNPTREYLSTGS
jgi:hypothetical protein